MHYPPLILSRSLRSLATKLVVCLSRSGPAWLLLPSSSWPTHKLSKPTASVLCATIKSCLRIPEEQVKFLHALWSRFSSFFMLIGVVAWMRRFAFNCGRGKARHHSGMLEYDEIVHAKHLLYKLSQQDHYPDVFLAVQQSTSLPPGHMLIKFSLTLSDQGHIRV